LRTALPRSSGSTAERRCSCASTASRDPRSSSTLTEQAPPARERGFMQKKKILLVDDSEIYRDMARYMLESRGYEVVTLSSPFAFGAAITREQPDLALVDAFMPALQGDQLIRLARQNNLWDCP